MTETDDRMEYRSEDVNIPDCDSHKTSGSYFQIRVRGQLDDSWSNYLEGMEVKLLEDGEMLLNGPVVDQAALMGVLLKLSHLNLQLLSVNQVDDGQKGDKNG